MCKSTNTSICIWIHVSIPIKIVDCYMNTISDMLNEKDFFGYCKKFEYNHDF